MNFPLNWFEWILTSRVGILLFIMDFSRTGSIDISLFEDDVCTLILFKIGQLIPVTETINRYRLGKYFNEVNNFRIFIKLHLKKHTHTNLELREYFRYHIYRNYVKIFPLVNSVSTSKKWVCSEIEKLKFWTVVLFKYSSRQLIRERRISCISPFSKGQFF